MTLFKNLFRISLLAGLSLIMVMSVTRFIALQSGTKLAQQQQIQHALSQDFSLLPRQHYDTSLVALSAFLTMQLHPDDYQSIAIAPTQAQQQSLTITSPQTKSAAPAWFIATFGNNSYSQTQTINLVNDTVIVTISNNEKWLADNLWHHTQQLIVEAGIISFSFTLVIFFLLRLSFTSFQRLTKYAEQLEQSHQINPPPHTRYKDLNQLNNSYRSLAHKLESHFRIQAKEAAHLREKAYRDPISQLGNREYFLNQLDAWLTKSEQGGLILIQAKVINQSYRHKNYQRGDHLIREIAQTLNQTITHSNSTLGRISKTEFAVLLPQIQQEKLHSLAELILGTLLPLTKEFDTPLGITIGLVITEHGTSASQLLAQLDNAVIAAAQSPSSPIALSEGENNTNNKGKQYWKELVLSAIRNQQIHFHYQPVLMQNNTVYHQEVFSTIKRNDEVISANQFVGALDELSQGIIFDKHVIVSCVKELQTDRQLPALAINLTRSSVQDPAFHRWLHELLPYHPLICKRLFFEIQEGCFIEGTDMTQLLCQLLNRFDVRFGIDNFGRHFKSLEYLNDFKPAYVKIDFAFTMQLNNPTQSAVLTSISRTAHSLGIETIATRVETETQLERLSELFISGFQGYIIERQVTRTNSVA
ncbi:EAL domain-containing protein [Photobacterium sanguinicancri]|uniref:EAL domain-containing protein n=1 Tax=Photobacterium sanguinicancri TaxID=875932 RepID=UPI003D0BBB81